MLLSLQILIGCVFFTLGCYGIFDAFKRRKKVGYFSADLDAAMWFGVVAISYLVALIGIILI